MTAVLSTASDYEALLRDYDTWLFDCDGVLWRGDHLLDGAVEVLDLLRRRNKKVVFVTNNATKYVDEIYGSAYAAAVYISSVIKLPKTKKVYVIGMAGLEEELQNEGITILGGTDPADNTLESFNLADFVRDPDVGAVVCGLDTKINYTKLSKAFQYPSSHGLLPGAGSISAPLRCALGKNPICTGKPASTMLDCIKAKVNFDPKRTIMVGDRLNTDILFGQNGGLATLLVLTGITKVTDIQGPNASPIVPDFVTEALGDFRVVEKAA